MNELRRKKNAFRPSLAGHALEERVVPSTAGTSFVRNHDSLLAANALNNLTASLSGRNLDNAVTHQIRSLTKTAQNAIHSEIAQLYAHGRPTAQQKADFRAMSNGVLAATALQLSNLAALLPAGRTVLAPGLQGSLIGSQSNSVASRISQALDSGRAGLNSRTLSASIAQTFNRSTNQDIHTFHTFLNGNTPFAQSVDQVGNQIPIGRYIGKQIVTQLGSTLGSLSQGFSQLSNSTLFANGSTTASAADQALLANRFGSALNVAASQLSAGLSLAPSLASTLTPRLQTALFNTSSTNMGLYGAIQNLPSSSNLFNTGASSAFNTSYLGLSSLLSTPFNLPTSSFNTLPTSTSSGFFGSQYSTYGNGFTTGFGTGFPGFGVPTSVFNTNFGTGFNSVINTVNRNFGFSTPIGTIDGTGSLTGTGNGTGTYLGAGSTSIGTIDGTGTLTGTGTGIGTFLGAGSTSIGTIDGTGSLTGTGNGMGTYLGAGSTSIGTFDGTGTLTGTGNGTGSGF